LHFWNPHCRNTVHTIYLDYAATTPLLPEVFEAMKPYYFQHYGNASSLHAFGLRARQAVEHARQSIAEVLGTEADSIVFTSGGTESNNLALQGIVSAVGIRPAHIITSAIEHSSVLNVCGYLEQQGHALNYIPVSNDGIVDPLLVEAAIRPNTVMISIQHANSEIGTLQPIDHIRRIALRHNIIFHTDAVQTFGKMQPPAVRDGISLLSSSAHKLYGPKGIGCLYINRADICMKMLSRPDLFPDPPETMLRPLMFGGEQEMGLRPSTENVPAIAGFGAAAEWARRCMDSEAARHAHPDAEDTAQKQRSYPGTD
jgi:cysteine desulfurase